MPVPIPFACSVRCRRRAVLGADGVDVIDVPGVGCLGRDLDAAIEQQPAVFDRVLPARVGPLVEMAQLDAKDAALHPFHAVVEALEHVVVLLLRAPVAQHPDPFRHRRVVGHDHAAFAVGAEVLARVEAEAPRVAERAHRTSFVRRAVRLAAVLDHLQAMAFRDVEDRVHVGRLAVEMDRDDRLGAAGDRLLELGHVHREGCRIDVDIGRPRAHVPDRGDGGDEGERHRDDLVAGSDAGGDQREMERAGAGIDGDPVRGALEGGKLLLERLDFRAEDELARVEHPSDGVGDVRFDGEILRAKVDQRNHTAHLLEENSTRRPDARIDSVAASSMRTTRRPEWPSAVGVLLFEMQSTKCRVSMLNASVSAICGAQTSPLR